MRRDLRENNILSERLRFSGKEGDESAEFVLHCKLINFLRFLTGFSGKKLQTGGLSYLSIGAIPGSAEANVTMRFYHASPDIPLPFRAVADTPPPETVALSFAGRQTAAGSGRTQPAKVPFTPETPVTGDGTTGFLAGGLVEDKAEELAEEPMKETEMLFLGFIREADGTKYAYHKEIMTGRIIKILQEEKDE
jgi:hypothetical protein